MNLLPFLEKNNYSFMELNAALLKAKHWNQNRQERCLPITMYLMSVEYKPHPIQFYHKFALKSLCKLRSEVVKQRSFYETTMADILDMTISRV